MVHVPCDGDQCCSAEPRTLESILVTPCGPAACRQIHAFRLAGCSPAKKKGQFPEIGLAVNFQKVHTLKMNGPSRPQQMENAILSFFCPSHSSPLQPADAFTTGSPSASSPRLVDPSDFQILLRPFVAPDRAALVACGIIGQDLCYEAPFHKLGHLGRRFP